MFDKLREEIAKCNEIAIELDKALWSTMGSSRAINEEINAARMRMRQQLEDMRESKKNSLRTHSSVG